MTSFHGTIVNNDQSELKRIKIGCRGEMHSSAGLTIHAVWSYPGRLWLNSKIISFWVYPNDILFKQIIIELEKELEIKIFNNNWQIEVIKRNGEVNKSEFSENVEDYYYDRREMNDQSELIPLDNYAGSEDFSDLQKQMHLMGWSEKQKLKEKGVKLAPGFGADRTAWDQPRNLKYRQSVYQEKKNS